MLCKHLSGWLQKRKPSPRAACGREVTVECLTDAIPSGESIIGWKMLIKIFLSAITINYSSGDRLMADNAGLFGGKCCKLDVQQTLEKINTENCQNCLTWTFAADVDGCNSHKTFFSRESCRVWQTTLSPP